MLELSDGPLRARIAPEMGGSLVHLGHGGITLSRDGPVSHALGGSGFPMAPWFSRISGGAYPFGGRMIAASVAGRGAVPADLHGLLWDRAFDVVAASEHDCLLACDVVASADQPYAFRAELRYALDAEGFSMALAVTNTGSRLPFGVGLHPFLRRTPGFRLRFAADGYLATTADAMPIRQAAADEIPALRGLDGLGDGAGLNHGFTGWAGPAMLDWTDLGLRGSLTAQADRPMLFHIYAPPGESYLCLEPVTNAPDVIHRRQFASVADMAPLDSGETLAISLRLAISEADPANAVSSA